MDPLRRRLFCPLNYERNAGHFHPEEDAEIIVGGIK